MKDESPVKGYESRVSVESLDEHESFNGESFTCYNTNTLSFNKNHIAYAPHTKVVLFI